jgi:hypothetical protein
MSSNNLPARFWFDLNNRYPIDANIGSDYHIQHVIRNPSSFGIKDIHKLASNETIEHIESGLRDVDSDLEHRIMEMGFIKGYHYRPPPDSTRSGLITIRAHNHDHAKLMLSQYILPIVKETEDAGRHYEVDLRVGHSVKDRDSANNFSFNSSESILNHINTPIENFKKIKSRDNISTATAGEVGQPVQISKTAAEIFRKQNPTMSQAEVNYKLRQMRGWGESNMSINKGKSFKELFTEMLNNKIHKSAYQQLRVAQLKSTRQKLQRAGGSDTMRGTAASVAGLTSSQLTALEKGRRISGKKAQDIVAKLFSDR